MGQWARARGSRAFGSFSCSCYFRAQHCRRRHPLLQSLCLRARSLTTGRLLMCELLLGEVAL